MVIIMTYFLTLWMGGQYLPLDEIADTLKLSPTYSYKKGDVWIDRLGQSVTYGEDCWMIEKKHIEAEDIEDEILGFISLFENNAEYIKNLAEKFKVYLWLSAYPESDQYNIHLSHKVIKAICNLGITMDIDITDLRVFYDGTYLSKSAD